MNTTFKDILKSELVRLEHLVDHTHTPSTYPIPMHRYIRRPQKSSMYSGLFSFVRVVQFLL